MHFRSHVRARVLRTGLPLAMALSVMAIAPMAASASSAPAGATTIFHVCQEIGTADGATEAVHCADLLSVQGSGFVRYIAQNEVFCENLANGETVQCAGIHEEPAIGAEEDPLAGGLVRYGPSGICGVRFGHSACSSGRVINSTDVAEDFDAEPGSGPCNVWAASVSDSVVLPGSGKVVSDANNVATPHDFFQCSVLH
jgi:hypothetical protein